MFASETSSPNRSRPRGRPLALTALLALLSLACAGLGSTLDVASHMEPVCDATASAGAVPGLMLASVEAPPTDLPQGAAVVVRSDGLTVDGRAPRSGEGVSLVREAVEHSRRVSTLRGAPQAVLVYVQADAPARVVVQALETLAEAGVTGVTFVGRSQAALELPPYPVPALAAEVKAEIDGLEPSERAVRMANRITDEIALCPGAGEVFAAVASASPEMKCALLAYGLVEALPTCLFTDADRVVTLVQLIVEPADPMRPTTVAVTLDPDGEAVEVAPDTPWHLIWPRLTDRFWLRLAT